MQAYLKSVLLVICGFVMGMIVLRENDPANQSTQSTYVQTLNHGSSEARPETSEATANGLPTNTSKPLQEVDQLKKIIEDQILDIEHKNQRISLLTAQLNKVKGEPFDASEAKNKLDDTEEQRLELVSEYFRISKIEETFTLAIEQALTGNYKGELTKEQYKHLLDQHLDWDSMKGAFYKSYTDVFNALELQDLVAFYHTPTGRKLVEQTPELTRKSVEVMQIIMKEKMAAFERDIAQIQAETAARQQTSM